MSADALLGTTLGGVRLVDYLGQGGMATVYRGIHEKLRKEVAVKVLRLTQGKHGKQMRERFLREADAAKSIKHDHVIAIYGSGTDGERAFLIMELVDGASIGDIIDEKGAIEPDRVINLGVAVARGLDAIHQAGFIHRDIKPDNLLIGAGGKVRISDLGLVRETSDPELNRLTATGIVVGTPLYVAPEAVKDAKSAGPPCDIYSLGATLFHMVAGEPPFDGESPYEVMRAHLQDAPPSIRKINPKVPKHLANTIAACLQKDPDKRPNARAVAKALGGGKGINRERRFSTVAMTIALVAVLLSGILVWRVVTRETGPQPASLTLGGHFDGVTIQIDDADPQALEGPILLEPGERNILAISTLDGRQLRDQFTLKVESGQGLERLLDLKPQPSQASLKDIPGTGPILLQGANRPASTPLSLPWQGQFAVGRWDGQSATWGWVEVGPRSATVDEWVQAPHPPRELWFRQVANDGRPAPAHHMVTYRELGYALKARRIDVPGSWPPPGVLPDLPATGLPPEVVEPVLPWFRERGARLPDKSEANALAPLLRQGIWHDESGRLYFTGTPSAGAALLVIVPTGE